MYNTLSPTNQLPHRKVQFPHARETPTRAFFVLNNLPRDQSITLITPGDTGRGQEAGGRGPIAPHLPIAATRDHKK